MDIATFIFSDWAENTYILYDGTGEACIVDPGCNTPEEREQLTSYVTEAGLKPVHLLNTHCHIDHVLGNKYIAETYGLSLLSHRGEQMVLDNMVQLAAMYGVPYDPSPPISQFVEEGDVVRFGDTTLQVLFTPGHSPASISFYHEGSQQLIGGDVLFQGSIGRTDLPGGNLQTLLSSIKDKLYPLGDEVRVYSGHGPVTSIGIERKTNPFLV